MSPVHPRPRGEHLPVTTDVPGFGGSSRPRGEHNALLHSIAPCFGSSPPARGTPTMKSSCSDRRRFIPARAGNTHRVLLSVVVGAVHPRPRGEHQCARRQRRPDRGSSPPARGTPPVPAVRVGDLRFIPARAGNTPPPPMGQGVLPGSSPPARGTRGAATGHRRRRRFIPARAGNTRYGVALRIEGSVHPRPRGEHASKAPVPIQELGSSPPARGTPCPPATPRGFPRFIPARAGNTP